MKGLFLLVFLFAGGIATQGENERKFELLEQPDNLIVIFANGPQAKQPNRGSGKANKEGSSSSSESREETAGGRGRRVGGGGMVDKMPKDWVRLWNGAALKVVLDGAANELMHFNQSGSAQLDRPDIVVGDLDSVNVATKQFYEGLGGVQMIRLEDQHKTDLEKAMDTISERIIANKSGNDINNSSYSGILLLGPIHGRFDLTMCTLNTMMVHATKCSHHPIMALDGPNFMVMLPAGRTQIGLSGMEITGKSGLFPIGQRPAKVSTKGFKWNLGDGRQEQQKDGANSTQTSLEFGGKLSCANQIQYANDIVVINTNEPILFTMELKKSDCVLKHGKKQKQQQSMD